MLLLCFTLLTASPEADAPVAPAIVAPSPKPDPALETEPRLDLPARADDDGSLGWTLLRTLIVLGLVVMLAYISLNWGMRRILGIRMPTVSSSLVSVIERVPLDQRRSVFVVKAAGEYLLVGGAEQSLNLLSKLDTAEVEKIQAAKHAAQPALTLSPFLQKLLGKGNRS